MLHGNIWVMPREGNQIGLCSGCGEERKLFDVKNKLCGSCAGKKGGRKPKAMKKSPTVTTGPAYTGDVMNAKSAIGKSTIPSQKERLEKHSSASELIPGKPLKIPLSSANAPQGTRQPAGKRSQSSRSDTGPGMNNQTAPASGETYLCDACRKPVRYGQQVCKCGTWCDWRNTPVVDDPAYLVCLECGAVAGLSSNPPAVCPHCNSSG